VLVNCANETCVCMCACYAGVLSVPDLRASQGVNLVTCAFDLERGAGSAGALDGPTHGTSLANVMSTQVPILYAFDHGFFTAF
jgi:hypothetical protein